MIDMRGSKTQINLKQRMDHHLISSTRKAHIYSITDSGSLFTISTTNHNFMCFQWEDGAYVGVKSISLYNQYVAPNRILFLENVFKGKDKIIDLPEIHQVWIRDNGELVVFRGY